MVLIVTLSAGSLSAGLLVDSAGNASTSLSNGDHPTLLTVATEQAGQPSPFDASYNGAELLAGNDFNQNWTHTYTNITTAFPGELIATATLTIGIYGHDSAFTGSQIASLTVDGTDVTALMNAQFESYGGDYITGIGVNPEYNTYAINLPASTFADLVDGNVLIALALQNPATSFQNNLSNAANLIFSTLVITTDTANVPEPSSSVLLLTGIAGLFGVGYRRRRKQTPEPETADA